MGISPSDVLVFVLWGGLIGFLAGLFGIGGGGLIVPLLVFSYTRSGVSPSALTHVAIGTSLFVIFFASLTGAYQHHKQKNVDWHASLVMGASSALAVSVTARIAVGLSGESLRAAFAVFTVLIALRMLTEKQRRDVEIPATPSGAGAVPLAGIGLIAGVISALTGVGGGGVTIPMMYYLLKMPLKLAIGTSSATIVITAFFAVAGYILAGVGRPDLPDWCFGFVDYPRGTALVLGSLVTARFGAYVSFRTPAIRLRRSFALFLILVAVYVLFLK